jgi:hypothetical protein
VLPVANNRTSGPDAVPTFSGPDADPEAGPFCVPREGAQVAATFDPAEMALRGRIGGLVQKSRHDPRLTTQAARATFLNSFEQLVDPEGKLPEAERQRRAEAARKAHFARMALRSARARSRAKNARARRGTAGQAGSGGARHGPDAGGS